MYDFIKLAFQQELDKRNDELKAKYEDNDTPIPKPDYW